MVVNLTYAEVQHLLAMLKWAQEVGGYTGNRDHYYARTTRLIEKLEHKEDEYR